ncbi:sigma-70 family RNA polymerase sigma factor [Brachybacterium sp. YJGR34]|uniref:sigma-70 family RNA polymerase sigma factor n=1 Tax=Brachybacterium sp. YJGR34 TaxID=2059911 RepID=UPI000E0ADA59|nr:sigma-70 family RNA polymerase sigma factor [Brachybacterium sp. YJGR34]
MTQQMDLAERFDQERPRLLAVAQKLLGTRADAEDAVQETWLRLARADAAAIENLPAWLTTVVSRVSLDVLRAPRRTRERSWEAEPWRNEPEATAGDPAELVAESDRIGGALLLLLELLSPAERIAFVLHDAFERPFDEIAAVLDRSPQAARQLASRARRQLRDADGPARADRDRGRRLVQAWLEAAQNGDVTALLSLLDDGAALRATSAAGTRTIHGAHAIAEQAVLSGRLAAHSTPILLGGRPGVAAVLRGRVVSIMAFDVAGEQIIGLDVLADPERLAALEVQAVLDAAPRGPAVAGWSHPR